ncbi:SDR family oxidoreductase [Trinickia caryophylli]|uniref:UDP-glucose 4-epimerase n=1 Tax=Trinickia caryophylli TaxID=28094 RepID=A0A1X7CID8_TRICW|nr:SDR family oxidoreductase [Trinickia caryophylli]PMS11550.1 NAD-dependent dehydratase [Trinickia caryophylli]TRX19897.1 SDR family oxidoreductase [Trinickia caryophylli]WQE12769.1 SDR family oxidoreductase [Trinickia caryophylli]SME96900.1 UDP-glucose 4-epimerase [Trinickia caryophylli]
MSRVVVTGANGFVGDALCRTLLERGHAVTGLVRRAGTCAPGVDEWVFDRADFEGIDEAWPASLEARCVVHLAARVHVMHDNAVDPLAAFRASNVQGALRVARAAQRHGVQRFVFVSSIKALGETDPGRPLREDDPALPQDAYGQSKREAELALHRFGREQGLDVVVVRPPLVYGPGVKANFLQLMRAIAAGLPLPLGALAAQRSLVYVGNLADALAECALDARAAHGCFHVADGEDTTTTELARSIGRHLRKPARLVPVPSGCLRLMGRMTGRAPQIERLTGSLRVDASRLRSTLGWQPPYSFEEGLAATARWYLTSRRSR